MPITYGAILIRTVAPCILVLKEKLEKTNAWLFINSYQIETKNYFKKVGFGCILTGEMEQ